MPRPTPIMDPCWPIPTLPCCPIVVVPCCPMVVDPCCPIVVSLPGWPTTAPPVVLVAPTPGPMIVPCRPIVVLPCWEVVVPLFCGALLAPAPAAPPVPLLVP